VSSHFPADVIRLTEQRDPRRPLRIAVVHGSHTGGHRAAAEALVSALNELPNVKATSIDTLAVSSKQVQGLQHDFYDLVSNKMPWLRRTGFRMSMRGNPVARTVGNWALAGKAMMSSEVLDHLRQQNPDIIVSTHSQTNSMLNYWKQHGDINVPVHSVLTDFLAHTMWSQKNIARYYVAADTTRQDLMRFGVDKSRICVTGIPISTTFAAAPVETPEALDTKLGLDPSLPTVLLLGGSLGGQRYSELVEALNAHPYPMQIVAITGRNEQARKNLEALAPTSRHPLVVRGFETQMAPWMRAADVVISRAGGLTSSELLALRKPVIIASPCAGLEEAQAKALSKTGVAWTADSSEQAASTVCKLLGDAKLRSSVQAKMNDVSRPDSSYRVAAEIVRAASPTALAANHG
jgi:processive 1,2-diacylglycerol beta-glucosyltransferase